jgi:hypothetical protein
VLAALEASSTAGAVPDLLVERTVRSSLELAAAHSIARLVTSPITSLAHGVLTAMMLNPLKWAGLAALLVGLALAGAGAIAPQVVKPRSDRGSPPVDAAVLAATVRSEPHRASSGSESGAKGGQPDSNAQTTSTTATSPANAAEPSVASTSPSAPTTPTEPLAEAQQHLERVARAAYQATWDAHRNGHATVEQVYDVSRRWMDAQRESARYPAAKVAAATAHLDRMREVLRVHGDRAHSPAKPAETARIKALVVEGELWLAEARARGQEHDTPQPQDPTGPELERGDRDRADATRRDGRAAEVVETAPGTDPKSRQVLAKLDEPIAMSFAQDTRLGDVLKYIKQATVTPTFSGIPIYVDPIGLQEAERSLDSTVIIDLEGVPLRRTLQLILAQLGLIYWVEDGMIYITAEESEQMTLGPAVRTPSPILVRAAKAERGELTLQEMKELIAQFEARRQVQKLAEGEESLPDVPAAATTAGAGAGAGNSPRTADLEQQIAALAKDLRELVELLKVERRAKKAPEGKSPQR